MSDSGTPTHSSHNGSSRSGASVSTKQKLSKQREIEVTEGDSSESHPAAALCAHQADAASNTPNPNQNPNAAAREPGSDPAASVAPTPAPTAATSSCASNGPHPHPQVNPQSVASKTLIAHQVCAPAISISNLSSSTSKSTNTSRVSASASNSASACSISRSGTGTRTTSEYSEHSPSPSRDSASSSRHSPQPVDDDLQRSPPVLPGVPTRQDSAGRCRISCSRLKSLQSQEEAAGALSSECNCAGEPSDPSTRVKTDRAAQRDSSTETSSILDATGCDVDEFLRHAFLKHPKTRPVLLKIEEALNAFVIDQLAREHRFPHMSSYQRMLVHRMAALYGLEHNIDPSRKAVLVTKPTTSSYVARLPTLSFKQMERLLLQSQQSVPSPQLATQRSTRSDTGAASSSAAADKLSPSSSRSMSKSKAPKRERDAPASAQLSLSVSRQSSQQSQSLHASDRESVSSSVRGAHQAESDSYRGGGGGGGHAPVESRSLDFTSDQRSRTRIYQLRTEHTNNTSSTSSSAGGARVVPPPSTLSVGQTAAAPRGPALTTRRLLTKEPNFYESLLISPIGTAIAPLATAAGSSAESVFLAQQQQSSAQAYYFNPQAQSAFLSASGPLQMFAHPPAAAATASLAATVPQHPQPQPVVPDQVINVATARMSLLLTLLRD